MTAQQGPSDTAPSSSRAAPPQTVPSEGDTLVIKQLYSGINRNDIDFVLTLLDPNVTRIEPEGFPTAGTYIGPSELRAHLNKGRSTWAEGSCEPIEFISIKNKIVVIVQIKVRLKSEVRWIDAQIADGFSIKDGHITEFHSFLDRQKALGWANL